MNVLFFSISCVFIPNTNVSLYQFTNLSAAEQKMATAVGVPESFVARKAAGQSVRKVGETAFFSYFSILY